MRIVKGRRWKNLAGEDVIHMLFDAQGRKRDVRDFDSTYNRYADEELHMVFLRHEK